MTAPADGTEAPSAIAGLLDSLVDSQKMFWFPQTEHCTPLSAPTTSALVRTHVVDNGFPLVLTEVTSLPQAQQ